MNKLFKLVKKAKRLRMKVCLRDNRVFLIYLAIYLFLYSYTFFWNRATSTIRRRHTVYIDAG